MPYKVKATLIILFFLLLTTIIGFVGIKAIKSVDKIDKQKEKTIETIALQEKNIKMQLPKKAVEDITVVVLNKQEEISEPIIIYDQKKDETNENEATQNQGKEENKPTTPVIEKNNNIKTNSKNEKAYYIKVNYTANVVTIYKKDEEDNYTVPYKAFVCSTGTATPKSGTYNMDYKYRWLRIIWKCIWSILYENSWKYFIPFGTIPRKRKSSIFRILGV